MEIVSNAGVPPGELMRPNSEVGSRAAFCLKCQNFKERSSPGWETAALSCVQQDGLERRSRRSGNTVLHVVIWLSLCQLLTCSEEITVGPKLMSPSPAAGAVQRINAGGML